VARHGDRPGRKDDSRLTSRIASFERTFRMQQCAPEAFAVDPESGDAQAFYDIDIPVAENLGG